MNDIKRELLKRGCIAKEEAIDKALDNAYEQIIIIVKECGGVLKTPACDEKMTLHAFYEDCNGTTRTEDIQGLRWDEELGLCICTGSMMDNYTFDTGYHFENYRNFEGRDAEEVEKMLNDMAYYVEFHDYDLVFAPTVRDIIGGIVSYL